MSSAVPAVRGRPDLSSSLRHFLVASMVNVVAADISTTLIAESPVAFPLSRGVAAETYEAYKDRALDQATAWLASLIRAFPHLAAERPSSLVECARLAFMGEQQREPDPWEMGIITAALMALLNRPMAVAGEA